MSDSRVPPHPDDPVEGNPFSLADPAHAAWETATHQAEAELFAWRAEVLAAPHPTGTGSEYANFCLRWWSQEPMGNSGHNSTKTDFDCAAYRASTHAPPEPGRTPNCATRINLGAVYGKAIPMSTLATSLAPFVSRFTIDKTGLAGSFDVELTWTPDSAFPNADSPSADAPPNSSGPSIFAALQEQLGLKLVSEKGSVAVLVVDHLEEPSAN